MKSFLFVIGILLQIYDVPGFVIPDEIPSLLSVIYSNIPTIKKGTDSRIGWGFRLGDRADFQVLVELGPQKYTQPLANEPNKVVSNKRNTLDDLASQLWAQRQEEKRQQQQQKESNQPPSEANSWIQSWSNGMKNKGPPQTIQTLQITEDEVKPGLGIGEIDAKSVIPEDRKSDIRTSYLTDKQIPVKVTVTSTTEKLYTTKESSSNIVE